MDNPNIGNRFTKLIKTTQTAHHFLAKANSDALKITTASVALIAALFSNITHAQSSESTQSYGTPDWRVAYTDDEYYYDDRFAKRIYVGAGIGASWLNPDSSEVPGLNVNDRVNNAAQIAIGTDLSKHFSLELHAADLGQAGFSPEGSIDYSVFGASALYYAGKSRHRFNRRGLTAFGRLGIGFLQNSASTNINYVQDNSSHLLIGAGLEYVFRPGIGIRAEAISFEEDIRYGQVGLIYRMGRKQNRERIRIVQAPSEPATVAEPTPLPEPISAPVTPPVAAAKIEPVVVPNPCDSISGVLEGVNFHTNSHELTAEAQDILREVAATLMQCQNMPLEITAHTDSHGPAEYNQDLSTRRANSTSDFLHGQGIDSSRITTTAYGETQPIDSNETAEGRRRNRRVELHIIKPES